MFWFKLWLIPALIILHVISFVVGWYADRASDDTNFDRCLFSIVVSLGWPLAIILVYYIVVCCELPRAIRRLYMKGV